MEIWLVRHGETFGNQKQLIQGHSGGKLTKLGEQQALLNQKKLKNVEFDDVYVSDSYRTRETASIILQNTNYKKVHLSPLLREKGGGVLEGEPLHTFRNNSKKSTLPFRDYKAEGGECWNDVNARAQKFFKNLCHTYLEGDETQGFKVDIQKAVDIGDDYSSLLPDSGEDHKQRKRDSSNSSSDKSTSVSSKKEELKQDTKHDCLKHNNEVKKILGNLKPWEAKHEDFKRILVVTHGGYIMEFYNVMKQINGQKISNSNCAKNCAVYIFGVEQKPISDVHKKDTVEESKDITENLTVDYLLLNHKFHDEFGFTKGPFPVDKKMEKNSILPAPMSKKTVSEAPMRKKSKEKPVLAKKNTFSEKAKIRGKSYGRIKLQTKPIPSKPALSNKI